MSEVAIAEPTTKKAPPIALAATKSELPKDGFAKERKQLDEGAAEIIWPDNLSKDSFHEFEYWLLGCLRRARRKAGLPPAQVQHEDQSEPSQDAERIPQKPR